jgi:flagellar protein FlgJ
MRVETAFPLSPPAPADAARIDKVARDMEGLFAQMMIRQMREAMPSDALFPGAAGQFRSLHDEQLAKTLTRGRGLGLAPMIARQLAQQAGLEAPAPAAKAGALPIAGEGARPRLMPLEGYARPLPAKRPDPPAPASGEALPVRPANAEPRANWIPAGAVPRLAPVPRPAASAKAATPAASTSDGPAGSRVEAFVREVWPHAQRVARELGVDPRAIVAQAALETGWGRSTLSGATGRGHNYFGIKATGGWSGGRVEANTLEYAGGGFRSERAAFRAYTGAEQSFADYAALLKRSPRYAQALGRGNDIRGFAEALQRGGYATDPAYARKIEAIATGPTLERALARIDIDNATGPGPRHALFAAAGVGAF